MDFRNKIIQGDCREVLRGLPAESVHCVITSPPYWGLRKYEGIPELIWGGDENCSHVFEGIIGQRATVYLNDVKTKMGPDRRPPAKQSITPRFGNVCSKCGAWKGDLGLEPMFELYIDHLLEVFQAVHRVLRPDGTLWLNLGDCYYNGDMGGCHRSRVTQSTKQPKVANLAYAPNRMPQEGLKPKDLVGIPWRVAFALQAAGWWLRQWVPWIKRCGLPEGAKDRPLSVIETVFLFSKSSTYYFDYESVKRKISEKTKTSRGYVNFQKNGTQAERPFKSMKEFEKRAFRNYDLLFDNLSTTFGPILNDEGIIALDVNNKGFGGLYFATFPELLVEPLLLAGCPEDGIVMDPFGGAGTVGLVAQRMNRDFLLVELSGEYCAEGENRIRSALPLFSKVKGVTWVNTERSRPGFGRIEK